MSAAEIEEIEVAENVENVNENSKDDSNDNDNKQVTDDQKQDAKASVKLRHTTDRKRSRSRYTIHNRGQSMHQQLANVRIYQPTFRMESKNPFNPEHVEFVIERCVKENVSEYMQWYKGNDATKFAKELSQEIRFRVKLLAFDRYRLIVFVNVVEKFYQTVCMQVGFLWDHQRDIWTHYRYETKTFFVNVAVFGVYWE